MEAELIDWLRRRLPPHPLLRLGLGDDAAVLDLAGVGQCVVTVDMVTDEVDFHLAEIDPRRAGRKALAVNLSDLAAMAAEPIAAVVALALPRGAGLELPVALYEGMLPLAERHGLVIAGGDTNSWPGRLAVSITALGRVTGNGPLRRDGAQPGDHLLVTGRLGGSILGHHLDFEPRVNEAQELAARYRLHAGIDISDGLLLDLSRLCQQSGTGAEVFADRVPVSEAAERLAAQRGDGRSPLDHAMGDGEDFELLLAVPPEDARRMVAEQPLDVPLTDFGRIVAEPGLWTIDGAGRRIPADARGWQHEF